MIDKNFYRLNRLLVQQLIPYSVYAQELHSHWLLLACNIVTSTSLKVSILTVKIWMLIKTVIVEKNIYKFYIIHFIFYSFRESLSFTIISLPYKIPDLNFIPGNILNLWFPLPFRIFVSFYHCSDCRQTLFLHDWLLYFFTLKKSSFSYWK